MEVKLEAVRGAARMIIANNTPGGITFTAIHDLLVKSGLEVCTDMLIQALRLEHAENGVTPAHDGRWVLGSATVLRWDQPAHWGRLWKARLAGQRSHRYDRLRVEIRHLVISGNDSAQMLIVVYRDGRVKLSAAGAAPMTAREFAELQLVVAEAREAIRGYERAHPLPQEAAA